MSKIKAQSFETKEQACELYQILIYVTKTSDVFHSYRYFSCHGITHTNISHLF